MTREQIVKYFNILLCVNKLTRRGGEKTIVTESEWFQSEESFTDGEVFL